MAVYQGTLATIRADVVAKLHLDVDGGDNAKVDTWINLAYQDVVQQTGYLQTSTTLSLVSGTNSYSIPAAVAWIKSLTLTYQDGSVTNPLRQVPLDTLLEYRRASTGVGDAVDSPVFAVTGQTVELWPTPGAGQVLRFWHVYLPTKLTADGDTPVIMEPFGSKLLEYGALVEGARYKKDPLLGDYEAAFQTWLARFQVWLNRRESVGPTRFRVWSLGRGPLRFGHPSVDAPWLT